jgi:hypothetical protein
MQRGLYLCTVSLQNQTPQLLIFGFMAEWVCGLHLFVGVEVVQGVVQGETAHGAASQS